MALTHEASLEAADYGRTQLEQTQFSASGTFRPEGTLYDQLGFVTQ